MEPRIKGFELLARRLSRASEWVFGLLGDANLDLGVELAERHGKLVSASHEADVIAMAMGYAVASGRLGIATVTRGPGLSNSLTALTEAVRSHVPLLLVVGDTAADSLGHPQAIDHRALAVATGSLIVDVRASSRLSEHVDDAVRLALSRSHPVVLNVPVDVQHAEVESDELDRSAQILVDDNRHAIVPDEQDLDRALGIVASAARPILLAGRGAVDAAAGPAILRLAHRLGAPVATTLPARGLFGGEAADLGVAGSLSTPVAIEAFHQADAVISFGAGLNPYTTGDGGLLQGAAIVQCDTDRAAFNRHHLADACILGDASATADAMWEALGVADARTTSFRNRVLRELIAGYDPRAAFTDKSSATSIDPRAMTHALPSLLPESHTLAVDAGRFMPYVLTHVPVATPRSLLTTLGFAPIGLGIPAALGMAYGCPGKPAVAVVGDGGFMLGGMGAFNTAVRHQLDLIVVVFNDRAYGAEETKLLRSGRATAAVEFSWPDLVPLAQALGGTGVQVTSEDDLTKARTTIESRSGPVLIDCQIDRKAAADLPL